MKKIPVEKISFLIPYFHLRSLLILSLFPFFFLACSKNDPFSTAETHLKQKADYLNDKAKMLQTPEFKIIDIKKIFPKSNPMPEPWAAMITFSMIHSEDKKEIMKENFRIIFEFKDPYWAPVKMESEQYWRSTGQTVPWKEITRESNHDGWSMLNSLLGLSGP